MRRIIKGSVLCFLFAGVVAPAYAQPLAEPQQPQEPPTGQPLMARPEGVSPGAEPLPEGDLLYVPLQSRQVYSVAPLRLIQTPRSTRQGIVDIAPYDPSRDPVGDENKLLDAFEISAGQTVGATTIVLSLIDEQGQVSERRIDVLVIDQAHASYGAYLEAQIKQLFPKSNVTVHVANETTAIVRGFVDRAEEVDTITRLVQGFMTQIGGVNATAINAIRVTGAQQVQLKVVIAEVQRSKIRNLGFDWSWIDLGGGPLSSDLQLTTGGFIPPSSGLFVPPMPGMTTTTAAGTITTAGTPFMPIVQSPLTDGANLVFNVTRASQFAFWGFLRAIVDNNLGKILAEPVLVTTSGQPAYFNVGGETPVLIPEGNATLAVQYRPFGTNLRFIPTVLGEGRIRLDVRPEVSELDPALAVTIGGGSVPGFRTRVAETTVEMENGESYAIAGLIQERQTARTSKVPFLGDLPLVGWAFQNKTYEQNDTELLIVVTPHLVEASNQAICKLPGRESRVPNDVEFYIGSKFEPPCFNDPYREPWKRHRQGLPDPTPRPVKRFDFYPEDGGQTQAVVPAETMPEPVSAPPMSRFDADSLATPAWESEPRQNAEPDLGALPEPAPVIADGVPAVSTEQMAPVSENVAHEQDIVPAPPAGVQSTKILSIEPGSTDRTEGRTVHWREKPRPAAGSTFEEAGWKKADPLVDE